MIGPGIKDRFLLGAVAGLFGNVAKMAVDEISLRLKISQRSFRSTAAGIWVNNFKEANNFKGQLLGLLSDFGLGLFGGVISVSMLSRIGRDHLWVKGTVYGLTLGASVTAFLSGFPTNKVSPKDAASNLSYMVAHVVYGLVTVYTASQLGHPAVWDVPPLNDYLKPTELTSEQMRALPGSTQLTKS